MTTEGDMYERQILAFEKISDGLAAMADSLHKLANPPYVISGPEDHLIDDALTRHAVDVVRAQAPLRGQENSQRRYYRVAELAGAALTTDGGHHKQWFLEQIYLALGLDPQRIDHEPGIAP
jgi:hypothetical protein